MQSVIDVDFEQMSSEDGLECSSEVTDLDYYDLHEQYNTIINIIRFLNFHDRDIIYFSCISRKTQEEISSILNKTQPAICYDLKKVMSQMDYVYYFSSIIHKMINFFKYDAGYLTDDECDMMLVLTYSLSIIKTGEVLGLHQITSKKRLEQIMFKIKINNPEIKSIFDTLLSKYGKIKKRIYNKRNCNKKNRN